MHATPFPFALLLCAASATPAAFAADVQVTVNGNVEFNLIGDAPLGAVSSGEDATLSFTIDSDVFVDSPNFPTRGYPIDAASFTLTFAAVSIGLQDPFPPGETPYFVIRNDDPAVDGFFVATSVDFPTAVPIDQGGIVEQFRNDFSVTYTGNMLTSLDVLDAVGTYDFTGLSVFNWTVADGPFDAMGMIFEDLTIEAAGSPWTDLGNALAGTNGAPQLVGEGTLVGGDPYGLVLSNALPNRTTFFVLGFTRIDVPFKGGVLVPAITAPNGLFVPLPTAADGTLVLQSTWPDGLPSGTAIYVQHWIPDAGGIFGFAASNAVEGVTP